MNKGTAIVGFLLCFLAGMGLMWGVDRNGSTHGGNAEATAEAFSSETWSDEEAAIPISSKDPVWGSRTAPVTLVLFSDFQCPFCTKVEATLNQLKEKYGPDKLRIVWKSNPLPFHKDAKPASLAAETVFRLGGSKAFWKFHASAFANQKELTPEHFEQWAAQAGVDKAKFKASFDKQEFAAKIDADMAVGSKSGVSGTPASFINGVLLSGAQPLDKFVSVVDEQLNAAKAAIASGTKADKVYVKLAGENKAKGPAPSEKKDNKREQPDDKTVWRVPAVNGPTKGNPNAQVTIVIFSDFQCPFCSRVNPTIEEVMKTYGDKVRVVWKNNPLPFHKQAEPAAELAMEARAQKGDKAFWAAHDLLFKNQQKLSEEDLVGYAKELGIDADKVKTAISDKKFKGDIQKDMDLADEVAATGTPHMFVNGRRLVGAQPLEKFKTIIDEEVKKTDAMLAKGVAAKNIYEEVIKDGKTPPPPEKKTTEAPAADSPWKGGEKAKVVIEIFSDFECPFCKKVGETMNQIERDYGDKIKLVWRHKPLPMHKNAPLASEASQEVFKQKGREAFWKYHDELFKNQKELDRASLENKAEPLGIDMAKFKKALDANSHKEFVESESKVADAAGISGTPAFVIGEVKGKDKKKELTGYFISGAQPFSKFKKLIDRALAEAGEKGGGDGEKGEKKAKKKKAE